MCVVECACDIAQDRDRIADWKRAAHEPGAQRFASHERHGEIREPTGITGGKERYDVGMLQLCGERYFSAKSFGVHSCGEFRRQNSNDDRAAER